MFRKHNIVVTTMTDDSYECTIEDAYGASEDSALRSFLAFQTPFYVHGGSLETTANLLAATFRRDGSYRTCNAKNERKRARVLKAHHVEQERRQDAYYAALRRDNPTW